MPQKTTAVDTKTIQALDRLVIETIGIPSLVLMDNAGRCVAQETLRQLKKYQTEKYKTARVCVFCGRGNNAGDGFVAALYLTNAGVFVQTFLIGRFRDLKSDAALYAQTLRHLRAPIFEINRIDGRALSALKKSSVIIDAIFGVGLNREVSEPFKNIIETLNAQEKPLISVDVPSGLDATTGKTYGVCAQAATTVTFTFPKKGFFKNEGPRYTGKIIVADIGIPKKLLRRI